MKKKRSKRNTLMGYAMYMGGTSLIASGLPTVARTPVQTIATTGSKFVAPIASVTGAGIVFRQLKQLKQLNKLKRRKK